MTYTYHAFPAPRKGWSVWDSIREVIRRCADEGQAVVAVYQIHRFCYAIVAEDGRVA
jgi:hypothetical protein